MIQRLPLLFGLLMFGFISAQSFGQSTVFFPPNTSNPLCNGSSNGSIVFDIQGDSTEFFFNWSGGNLPTNGNPISGLGVRRQTGLRAGTYSIFVLDLASGLDTTVDVVLANPQPISVNAGNDFSACLGAAINLTATTNAAPGSVIRWSYSNANGLQTLTGSSVTIPASPSPLAIITATNISVLLTDPNSCTATDLVRVTINPVPVGSANPSAPNICSGPLSVALSGNLSNTTFIWSVVQSGTTGALGGSGTAINQNIRATGTNNGTATYTVRPTAGGCFGSPFTVVATVRPKPVATSLPDSTELCSGTQTNFALSSNIANASFAWRANPVSVTGSSNSTGNTIQQTLVSTLVQGKVVYRVAATANGCVSDSIRVVAVVKPRPTISVTPADTINVCSGNIGTFNYGTSPNGALVSWTVGSNTVGAVSGTGNVNAQTYTNTTTLTQRATFTVVSSLNGCSSTVRQTRVRVRPVPNVSFAVLKDTVCTGSPINITLSSSLPGSNTFAWTSTAIGASGNTSPGTGASINNTLTATGAAVGSVTYRAIATKENCPGPAATKTVFVNPAPSVIVLPTRSTICSGQNALIGISSQVSGTNFSWTINAGTITGASAGTGNQINQTLVNPGAGVDSVAYSIVPSLGSCLGTATRSVVLVRGKSLPVVDNANPVICSGGRLLINITSTGSFSWLVSGTGVSGAIAGSGASINQILNLTGPTDANLTYKIFGLVSGCISDTLFVPVTVNRSPVVTLISPIDSICSGQNARIQIVSNPGDNANISWTAVSTNVTGASDGTGSTIDQTLNLVSGTIGKAKYNVSVSRFGCVGNASDSIFVRIPTIPFTATPSSTIVCTGNTVQIALSSIQNNVTYAWTVSASGVSGASAGTGNLINQTLSLNGLGAGFVDYIITPSSGGCVGLPQTVRVSVQTSPAKPTITVSGGTSPICPGNSLTLTSSQLFGNQWTFNGSPIAVPIGNQRTLIASDSGLYRVVFTQTAGCVATSDPFRIQFFATPATPVISGNPGFCPGGSSRLKSSNLAGNQWQINGADINGATDTVFVASIAGDYTVRTRLVTCPATSAIFTVTAFPAPLQPDISGNIFLCAGDSGILSSTSAATYQWIFNNNPIVNQTSQTLKIKQGGNYQVRISDINTCSATSNIFNVQGVPANPTPLVTGTLNFCPGDSTILTTNNVNPAWKNQWFRNGVLLVNDTLRTLVVKLAGSYTVTLKSPRGCVSTSLPSIVTERPVPSIPVISGLSLLCPGGSVLLTSSSATGNVWFLNGSQINGANDPTFSAQSIGSYSVTVTNEQGCKSTSAAFEISPTSDITSTATISDPTSCGTPNGSIQVSTSGGSGQYDYVWSPATGGIVQGQEDQTAVSAGNYSVLVTDRLSGCSQLISGIVLNDPATFSATAQVVNVTSCTNPNGRINLTITGSNGPFTFVWTGPATGNTQNLTNIPSGFYSVAIKETSSNCTFILDSIEVNSNVPPKPDITASGPLEFCAGDSIVLKTTAVGPYQWARIGSGALAGQTFDSLIVKTSGLYYVRVANLGFPNCFSRSDTLNIIANPPPGNPNINASNSAVCQGVSVSLTTTSNLTKQWTLNGNDISGATSSFINVTEGGTYCLKVTDGNGCSRVSTTCRTITINPIPPAAVITGNPGFCPGGSTVLTAIPFDSTLYNYTWLRNNNFVGNSDRSQLTVSLAGWYKIRVLNEATQCRTFGDSVFITNFNSPPAPTISGSSSICSGSSAILVSSQAATYQWLLNGTPIPGATNDSLTITQAGAYSVAITDFNNCGSTSSSFAVSEIASPTASTITGNATFCAGSSSILTASANANYQWLFNGSPLLGQTGQTISADLFGDYSVLVSNTLGCSDTSLVFTTLQGAASFTVDTSIVGTSCQNGLPQTNGQISVTTTGGSGTFLFEWTPALPPTPNQTNLSAGTYAVLITDQTSGCEINLQNLVVTPTPTLSIVSTITNDSSCILDNGSVTVNVSGGSGNYTFTWTSLASTTNTISNLGAGNYEVFVTDVASSCVQAFDSLTVLGVDTFTTSANVTQATSCIGFGLIAVSNNGGTGNFNYTWSGTGTGIVTNQAIQPNLTAGTYRVIVQDDGSKCIRIIDDMVLNPVNNLNINIQASNPTTCGANDGTASADIGVSGGTYLWTQIAGGSFTGTDSAVTGLSAGTYKVKVNVGSCLDSSEITLDPGNLGLSAVSDSADCNDANGTAIISAIGNVTGATYTWTKNGNTTFSATGSSQSNLSSGTYKVLVINNSCRDSILVVVPKKINCPTPVCSLNVTASFSPNSVSDCNSAIDLIATVSGAINPIFQWSLVGNPTVLSTNNPFFTKFVGNYMVIVSEGQCRDTAFVNSLQGGLVGSVDSSDCLNTNGSISVQPFPGDFDYLWTKIGDPTFTRNTSSIFGLSAGFYQVFQGVTCGATKIFQVFQKRDCPTPVCALTVSATKTDPTACGLSNGQANAIISNGTNPTISWRRLPSVTVIGTSANLPNLGTGTYQVIVNEGLCADTAQVTLTAPGAFTISTLQTPATCADNDGAINLTITGAGSGVSIRWTKIGTPSFTSTSEDISNLSAGTYKVVVTDGACKDSVETIVTKPTNCNPCTLSVSATKTDPTACGLSNGQANAIITNGTNPTISWRRLPSGTVIGTSANLPNLGTGTYQVIVTEGLCADTAQVTLTAPGAFTISTLQTAATCADNDGAINLTITGASPGVSIKWTKIGTPLFTSTSEDISNLSAGTYKVVVTDGACKDSVETIVTKPTNCNPCTLSVSATKTDPTACGLSDGQANAIITNGTNPTISWTRLPSATVIGASANLSNLGTGTYQVIVTEGLCADTAQVTLTAPGAFTISTLQTPATCADNDGAINLTITGAGSGVSIRWTKIGTISFTSTSEDISNLSAGTYKVMVTDGACKDSVETIVTKPTNCGGCTLSISAVQDSATCADNDGSINLTVNGASTAVQFTWTKIGTPSFVANSEDVSNLSSGVYKILVRDGNCKDSTFVVVLKPGNCATCNLSLAAVQDSATCADNDGSINLTVNGASAAVQFAWTKIGTPSFNANSEDISNLSSGVYKILVRDGSCKDSTFVVVLKPGNCSGCNFSIAATPDSASCADNDGSITLNVTGASINAQYKWSKIGTPAFTANTQNISNLSAGVYKVVISDGTCKDSTLVLINKPANCGPCNLQVVASSTPVTCAGVSNGTAFAFITSGGVGPFTYNLNGTQEQTLPEFLASFTDQPSGPFSVAVKDETTLCTDTVEGFIGAQLGLSASAFTQNPSCGSPNGSIRVVVSGGTGPYTFTIGAQALTTNDGDTIFTGLAAGTYSVSINNALGCATSVSDIVLIQPQPVALTFGTIKPASCNQNADGSIRVTTISGASAFTYFIPNVTTGFQTIAAGDTIKNLPAGTYQMTIRGISACDLETSFTIPGPAKVVLTASALSNSACLDSTGTARLTSLTGGNGAPWNFKLFLDNTQFSSGGLPSDSIFRDLAAGNYALVVSDSNDCQDTTRFSIQTQTVSPLVSITADKLQICSGDTVNFSASNLANITSPQYAWYLNGKPLNINTVSFKIDSLKNGDSVQVKLSGLPLCLNPDSVWSAAIKVNVIPANLQALAGIDAIKVEACIGQSATLKAINLNNLPNVGYRWIVNGTQLPTDTNQTLILFPGLPVNTVRAIVFSRLTSSCITKQSDTSDVQLVKQIEAITLTRTLIQTAPAAGQIICPNTPVSFGIQTNLKGKVDFKVQWWRNDTLVGTTVDTFFTFNSLPNGAQIQAVAIFDTTLTCVTSNFGKGKDSTSTQIISVLPAGDIRCLPCALVLNVTPTNINCAGGATGSIQAQVTGGSGRYDYSLLPNGPANQSFPFFFGLAPGTYSVSVRDSVTNCTKTVSGLNIVAVNAYNVFVSAVNPTPCVAQADGKLEFVTVTDASGDINKYKFRIRSTDPYTTNRLFTGLPSGTYIMEVIDTITGCFTQNVRTLTAPAALQAQVSITALPGCYGQFNGQIQLDTVLNGSGFYQYSLSGDSGTYASVGINNPIPQGFGAGQFQLFFKDLQTGCLDTALVNITQPDSLKLSASVLINSQCSVPTGQIKLLEFSGGTGGKKLEVKLPNASVFLPVVVSADSILLNLAGGDYVFQLTDTNNCSKQFILNLPNNSPRAQQITVVKPCIGDTNGTIRLSGLVGGNKPYTFTLNNSQGDVLKVQTDSVFSQLKPGTYGITLTDASNPSCEVKYVREVSEPTKVKFTIAGIIASTCENFDGKIKFTLAGGQPGFKYAFDSLPGVFTSFKAMVGDTLMLSGLSKRADGNPYTLRLTDSGPGAGCAADTTFNIPGNSPLRFKFALRNVKCFGENSGAVLIDSLNGTGPVTLKVVDVASGALVKEDSIPGNLFLNNQFVLGGLPAGQFNLVVQQYGECQASRTFPFALSQPTQINISARPYKPSADGFAQGSILLDTVKGSVAPYLVLFNEGTYFTYKPDTLFDNLNPGKYTITVQDSIGCEVSKELEVVNDTQLFIPTLFTPNGDGINDLLIIKNLPAGSSLNIRNRWGEEVLNANPYNNDWDAKDIQDGTYFYILKIPNLENQNGWMEIKR